MISGIIKNSDAAKEDNVQVTYEEKREFTVIDLVRKKDDAVFQRVSRSIDATRRCGNQYFVRLEIFDLL